MPKPPLEHTYLIVEEYLHSSIQSRVNCRGLKVIVPVILAIIILQDSRQKAYYGSDYTEQSNIKSNVSSKTIDGCCKGFLHIASLRHSIMMWIIRDLLTAIKLVRNIT